MNTSHKHTHRALLFAALAIVFSFFGWLLASQAAAGSAVGSGQARPTASEPAASHAVLAEGAEPVTPPLIFNEWRELGHAPAEPDPLTPCDKPQPTLSAALRCRGRNPVQQPASAEVAKAPAAPRAVAALLYDQMNNASIADGTVDQDFEAANNNLDSEGADDFVVPAGQVWAVNRVDMLGQYVGATPPGTVSPVNVTIYANSPGGGNPNLPGAALCTYTNLTPTAAASGFDTSFSVMLPTPCKLPAGTYWLGFQTVLDSNGQTEFHFWRNRTTQTGSEGVWRNPLGGFGTGCDTFMPQSVCGVGGGNPDFLFQIHGVICPNITVNPAPPLPVGVVNVPYSPTVFTQSGGMAPATFALSGALPGGMMFNAATATLSGTPTIPGSFPVTIMATDMNGCMGATSYTLTVVALPPPSPNTLVKLNPTDPILCAGGIVNGAFGQANTTPLPLTGRLFATLTNLGATPGSVACTLTPAAGGATAFCGIENGLPTWRGTLAVGQRVDVTYQGQVLEGATTQVCSTANAQFPEGSPSVLSPPACVNLNCPGTVGPGMPPDARSIINDQKAGSVLIYNIYTSSTNPVQQNTRLNLTNTSTTSAVFVHLFFVDGSTCAVADNYLCLTANQTASFLASDLDPGTTGYVVAVATDRTGCPIVFNHLIGDEYVKFASGHAATVGADAVAALPGGLAFCDLTANTAVLRFDGVNYNALPHVLAVDNVPSRLDGNDTMLILNRLGGSLVTGAATLGTVVGILYDDAENALSFSFTAGTCQVRGSLSNSFPRTAPRFESFIPAGRSGWLKLYAPPATTGGPRPGVSAAVLNANTTANGFNQGHNLHKLTLTLDTVYTIPVFPPSC